MLVSYFFPVVGKEFEPVNLLLWIEHADHTSTSTTQHIPSLGSGCGSVDKSVASQTGGPQFESRHLQSF